MGLRDKYAKRDAELGFRPIDLSEGNVSAIFNRCLATEAEKADPKLSVGARVQYYVWTGYDSEEFFFSRKKLQDNAKYIRYLAGQLAPLQTTDLVTIIVEDCKKKYDGTNWYSASKSLLQLYLLGSRSDIFDPIVKMYQGIGPEETFARHNPMFSMVSEYEKLMETDPALARDVLEQLGVPRDMTPSEYFAELKSIYNKYYNKYLDMRTLLSFGFLRNRRIANLYKDAKDGTVFALSAKNESGPTLSPNDPNFPAWWEAHKSEWE